MNDVPGFGPNDLNVIFIGVAIVFLILILITVVLYLFPLFFKRKGGKKPAKGKELPEISEISRLSGNAAITPSASDAGSDEEIAAVITAALEAYNAQHGGTTSFRVRSFRRVGGKNGNRH